MRAARTEACECLKCDAQGADVGNDGDGDRGGGEIGGSAPTLLELFPRCPPLALWLPSIPPPGPFD